MTDACTHSEVEGTQHLPSTVEQTGPEIIDTLHVALVCAEPDCERKISGTANMVHFQGEGFNSQPSVSLAALFGFAVRDGFQVIPGNYDARQPMRILCPDHRES